MRHPRYAMLALPLLRAEIPGWGKIGRITRIVGAESDKFWGGAE